MRRLVNGALLLGFLWAIVPISISAQEDLTGTWTLQLRSTAAADEGYLDLRLRHDAGERHDDNMSADIGLQRLGLSRAVIESGAPSPHSFALNAEAGSISFTGTLGDGTGVGRFTFRANGDYAGRLAQRGFDRPDAHKLLAATLYDLSIAYIDGMAEAGYPTKSFEQALAFRALGITPESARALRAAFGALDAAKLMSVAALRVTPAYAADLRSAGISGLSVDGLIQMKALGIDAAYVRGLASEGYSNMPTEQIVQFKALRVTAAYLNDLASAGFKNIPASDVVQLRALGIDRAFIDRMRAHGLKNLSVSQLVRLKSAGI